jgi:hypothetical protein
MERIACKKSISSGEIAPSSTRASKFKVRSEYALPKITSGIDFPSER